MPGQAERAAYILLNKPPRNFQFGMVMKIVRCRSFQKFNIQVKMKYQQGRKKMKLDTIDSDGKDDSVVENKGQNLNMIKCDYCDYKTSRKNTLSQHYSLKHKNEKLEKCPGHFPICPCKQS